jgi:hypothetical protein
MRHRSIRGKIMAKILKIQIAGLCLILSSAMQTGCAMHKVASAWHGNYNLIADGSDSEWQAEPRYYDEANQVAIRAMNDMKGIYLCFSTGDNKLKQTITMTGLTLWLDPEGGKNRIFGVGIPPGHRLLMPFFSDQERKETQLMNKKGMPPFEAPVELDITYPNTTGPLTMTRAETRNAGIEVGAGQPPGGRVVYEFKIRFDADESLLSLKPGMVVGVGFETGKMEMPRHKDMQDDGNDMGMPRMDMGPPNGDMDGPESGSFPSMKKVKSYDIWIKIKLADQKELKIN